MGLLSAWSADSLLGPAVGIEGVFERLGVTARRLRCPPKTVLFEAGRVGSDAHLVTSGRCKLRRITPHGEVIVGMCGPGEVVGGFAALEGLPYDADGVTVEESIVLVLRASDLRLAIGSVPDAGSTLLGAVARELAAAHDRIVMPTQPVPARIASVLLQAIESRPDPSGREQGTVMPMNEIASFAATTPETVSRILSRWERLTIIARRGRAIVIVDAARLHREALE